MRLTVLLVLVLVCMELAPTSGWRRRRKSKKNKPKTTVTANVEADNGGHKVSGSINHKGDGWSGGVSGSRNSNGDWSVKAKATLEFKKRSIDWNGKHYSVTFSVDQCSFDAYDMDGNGYINKEDMLNLFGDGKEAENFFNDLNLTTDDDIVTEDEFNFMAPLTIKGCEVTEIPNPQ